MCLLKKKKMLTMNLKSITYLTIFLSNIEKETHYINLGHSRLTRENYRDNL